MHNKNPEERTEYPLKSAEARVKAENKERKSFGLYVRV